MDTKRPLCSAIPTSFFFFFFSFLAFAEDNESRVVNKLLSGRNYSFVDIGVVLDLGSPFGLMADLCIDMAIEDFYLEHPYYRTRLRLHTKGAHTPVDVNFAVQELLRDEKVHGVLGPDGSVQDAFFAGLGDRVHVPIISFTARTSSLPYTEGRYSVRTTPDDAVQSRAIAAICRGFEWPQVVVLYEDTEYGNRFLSHLNEAFQEIEVGIAYMKAFPKWADERLLLSELGKLTLRQTRVFVVHMSPSLGYLLFSAAKSAGMMSEGHAWIITDSLSSFTDSIDPATREAMEGVLAVRPYVVPSRNLQNFQARWKHNVTLKKSKVPIMELNVYGLWAYDTVTALAVAVENIGPVNPSSSYEGTRSGSVSRNFGVSSIGPMLLNELSATKFRGLQGDFQLVDGKLKPWAYEIINLIGTGQKSVGFWTPERGITREISSTARPSYSTSTKELKKIIWPGDSLTPPKGWAFPSTGKLRIGVPRKLGFTEFVNVSADSAKNHVNATGFSIDIFLATLNLLPFKLDYEFLYEYTSDVNWSYDDMLRQIPEKYDMVVGDTTNWAPRAAYVDFSLPYSEAGVILVVKNKKPFDMWIFIKPLSWDLWLAIILSCILMGIVLRMLENPDAKKGRDAARSRRMHARSAYLSPVAVLAFPERNMVSNNWSFLVLVFWVFMAFILMQSYTANLSAILTVDQLKFAFSDEYYIGYQEGSFMRNFLIEQLHINPLRLRSYASPHEYHKAMSNGSSNGGIDAIFDEIPYMKLLLNKYDSQYKMYGPTYRTGGFGFAFPKGSPLASHFSKAILDVTQGPNMTAIEQKNFGPGFSSQDPLTSRISQQTSSLSIFHFAGLFIIVGSVTLLALFFSATPIGRWATTKIEIFITKYLHFRKSRVSSTDDNISDGDMDNGIHTSQSVKDNGSIGPLKGQRAEQDVGDAPREEHDEIQEENDQASGCYGFDNRGTMIAAANRALYNNGAACGTQYRVRCTGPTNLGVPQRCRNGEIIVTIVDLCPACGGDQLDLALPAFSAIADTAAGRIRIEYNRV